MLSPELQIKYQNLKSIIKGYPDLLVAYSGGVDSAVLLKVAADVLGRKTLGVIGVSPSLPEREREDAEKIAGDFSLPYTLLETHEMEDERYRSNPFDRCYYCKKELFSEIFDFAKENGFRNVADGSNLDDDVDFRPGRQAAKELSVVSPLRAAKLNKQDIRELAKFIGLPIWNKPAAACLSSRFPTGTPINKPALRQVEMGENFLLDLGFKIVRVRHHDKLARIEVGQEEIERFLDPATREKVGSYFRQIGYSFITLDLMGYRMAGLSQASGTRGEGQATGKFVQ